MSSHFITPKPDRMDHHLNLEHGDYFTIRRPLLPLETLDSLLARYRTLVPEDSPKVLRELLAEPNVSNAVRLSSPGFYKRLLACADEDASDALAAMMRFVVRMATRATPFAAFASVGLGRFGPDVSTEILPEITCRLEIDYAVLSHIHDRLRRALPLRGALRMRRTPVLHAMSGHYRYMERTLNGEAYMFRLSSIAQTSYIDLVMAALAQPATIESLVQALREFDAELQTDDAEQFIAALSDSGLIEIDAEIPLTGGRPLKRYLDNLAEAAPASATLPEFALLSEIQRILAEPCTLEQAPQRIEAVEQLLTNQDYKIVPGKAVHVDSFSKQNDLTLSATLITDLQEAIGVLHRFFSVPGDDTLRKFANAFDHRFGHQVIPLMAALDPDTGIPFGFSSAPVPWIAGLGLQGISQPRDNDALLHSSLAHALQFKQHVIDLAELDLRPQRERSEFPADVSVLLSLYGTAQQPQVALQAVNTPGATNYNARFAARDETLAMALASSIAREDARQPDAIFAEIVHIPAARAANVLRRAGLRMYEIVLSGAGSVAPERQIQVDDLYITVIDGNVVLWSRRLQRRVIPRLSSAHHFAGKGNLGLYQFLCHLALQSNSSALFRWPQAMSSAPFLPRVMYKSVMLVRARWQLMASEATALRRHIQSREWAAFDALWDQLQLPRWVAVEQGDNLLEVDRESQLSLAMLADELSKHKGVILVESPARIGSPLFHHENQHWHAELVVPLHRPAQHKSADYAVPEFDSQDNVAGPHWTYYKIYGGESYLDGLLNDQLYPFMQRAVTEGAIQAWFYVRYRDPEFHLRLRWLGEGATMANFTHRLVNGLLEPLRRTHELSASMSDAYLPETRRYGGPKLMPHVEHVFYIDSEYCLDIRVAAQAMGNDELIWKGALAGAVDYMSAFGYGWEANSVFAQGQRNGFARELNLGDIQMQQLGVLYRRHRQYIEASVVNPASVAPAVLAALEKRRRRTAEALAIMSSHVAPAEREMLLGSIIHMQCNRLFASLSRPQEFVMWDFLVRACRSVAARNKVEA